MASPPVLALPAAFSGDWWDETQWAVFMALVDAVVLPVVAESQAADEKSHQKISDVEFERAYQEAQASMTEPPSREVFARYLAERASDNPAFVDAVRRSVADIPPSARKMLGGVLWALS